MSAWARLFKAIRRRPFRSALAVLAIVAVLALAGVAAMLYSEPGRTALARYLEGALSTPGDIEIEIGHLHGRLPAEIRIDRITLKDSDGAWLTVHDIEVDWSPQDLFAAKLRIDSARAGEIVIRRQPTPSEGPAPSAGNKAGAILPPFEIDLENLAVDAVRLEEPVLGQTASLKLAASASALRDRAAARLTFDRADGMPGHANAALEWNASTGALDIDAAFSEPADGLLARLLDLPGKPPLDLSVTGDGPAGDWRGRVILEAGSLLSLASSLSISIDRDFRIALQGDATPGESLGLEVMSVLGPQTAFDLELLHTADSGDWDVTINGLTSAAITGRGNGKISPTAAQTEGTLEIETVDISRLATLAEPVAFSSATARIGFSGPLTHPVIQLEGMIDDLAVEGFTATRTNLLAELRPDGPLDAGESRISMNGEVRFDHLETPSAELSGLLGETPHIAISDTRLDRFTRMNIGKVTVSGVNVGVSLGGDIALDSGVLDAAGQAKIDDLAVLSDAVGRAVAGWLQVDFTVARKADGAIDLTLDGGLRDASLEQPMVERLLGTNARFAGNIRRQPDGMLSISELTLSGKGLEAKARLSVNPDIESLEADYDIAISDLGALEVGDPNQPGGTLGVAGKATGPIANPAVEGLLRLADAAPGGFPVKRLDARYKVSDVATAPRGDVNLTGEIYLLPDLAGQIGFILTENLLTLHQLKLSAREASVEGALSVPLGGQAVVGDLRIRAPDVGPWSAVAGLTLAGKLDAWIDLRGDGDRQDGVLDATLANFAIDDQLSSRQIKLDMRVADIVGVPRLKGSIVADDTQSGAAKIAELTLGLDGVLQDLQYQLHTVGNVDDRGLSLDANGRLHKTDESTTLAIASLVGQAADIPFRLRKPALLEFEPAIDSGDIDMEIGDGTMRGSYSQAGGRVAMKADINAIPLRSLWPTPPPQLENAIIDAKASLDGPLGGPTGGLDLLVTGLAAGETKETKEGLTLALKSELGGGKLNVTGRIDGLAETTSRLQLSVPAQLSLAPAVFSVDEQAPLTASLTYVGPVGSSWLLLGLDRHRLEGQGDVALEISGTLDDPRISGRAEMVNGLYENLDTGTILSDIQVSARPSNSSLAIDKFVAKDGGEGEISVSGGIDFGGGELTTMDLQVGFNKAHLIRRDELKAVASGQVAFRGDGSKSEISGKLTVDEAEIMLAGGLPPGVVEITVEEKGTPPAGAAKAPAPAKPSRTDLNIEISIPKRVFVRGQGLDSEWGGELKITGTTALPRIQGELYPVRGRYDFAGHIFTLEKSSITFVGEDEIDPTLDISAERETTDLTAIIHVTGTAKKPKVALESIPEQPQDEILGRVLFNKSTGRLTATEALQLAQALRKLSGASDGGGIMEFARGMFNLDVLRFQGDNQDGATGAEAGKYISDSIYVGVEGNSSGETGVIVEIEITPRLKLESDVGQKDKNQLGLKWKRDY